MELKFLETKKKSRPVTWKDIPKVIWQSFKIKWAMMKPFPGRWPNASAISQCQIDQDDPLRFFVLGNGWHQFDNRPVKLSRYFGFPFPRTIINPTIISHGNVQIKSMEGCYSFSNEKTRRIKRWEIVEVKFWTLFSIFPRIKKLYLYRAVVVQHEIDHMDGISIEDRYFKRS